MLLFSTMTRLLDCSCNHIIISQVHKQRNVSRTNGAPCLRLIQTHYYLNNITNNLEVTLRTCPSPAFTQALILLVKFLTTFLMPSCPRSFAVLAGDQRQISVLVRNCQRIW